MLLLSEVTFPFCLGLLGSSEPNLQDTSNNLTKLHNIAILYTHIVFDLISFSYLFFSYSPNFLVYLYPFAFIAFQSCFKFFFGTR